MSTMSTLTTAPTSVASISSSSDNIFASGGDRPNAFDMGFGPLVATNGSYVPTSAEMKANDWMVMAIVLAGIGLVVAVFISVFLATFRRVTGHWNFFKVANWRKRDEIEETTQFNNEPGTIIDGSGLQQRVMPGQESQLGKEKKALMVGASLAEPVFREAQPDADLPEYGGRLTLPPSYHRRASQEKRHSGGWMQADKGFLLPRPQSPPGASYVLDDEAISPKTPSPMVPRATSAEV